MFIIGVVGAWQIVAAAQFWPPYALPSPQMVFQTMLSNIENGRLPQALYISLGRLGIGYSISLAIGMTLGLLSGTVKAVDDTIGVALVGLQSLPSIAWLPLAVLWFGLNESAIIFVVLMGSLFAIAVSVRSGARNAPPIFRRVGETYGANRWQMHTSVILPGMAPTVVQGLKLGWSFAWRSLMAGELLYAGLGLGQTLSMGRDLQDMSLVLSVMLVIITVGLTIDSLIFGRLEAMIQERWGLSGK